MPSKNALRMKNCILDAPCFIVYLLSVNCIYNTLQIIASWLCRRAENLEHIFPDEWPDNGLKLAGVFSNVQKRLCKLGCVRCGWFLCDLHLKFFEPD